MSYLYYFRSLYHLGDFDTARRVVRTPPLRGRFARGDTALKRHGTSFTPSQSLFHCSVSEVRLFSFSLSLSANFLLLADSTAAFLSPVVVIATVYTCTGSDAISGILSGRMHMCGARNKIAWVWLARD